MNAAASLPPPIIEALPSIPVVFWVFVAGLVVQAFVLGVVGAWWVARVMSRFDSRITAERAEAEKNFLTRIEQVERNFGNALGVLRDHVHTHQLFVRDTFVRRGSFVKILDGAEARFATAMEKFDRQLEKISDRLHKVVGKD